MQTTKGERAKCRHCDMPSPDGEYLYSHAGVFCGPACHDVFLKHLQPPPSPGVRERAIAWDAAGRCGNCGGVPLATTAPPFFKGIGVICICSVRCEIKLRERLRLERQREATRAQAPPVPDSTAPVEVRGDGLDKIIARLKSERSTRDYYLDEAAKAVRDGLLESSRQCLDLAGTGTTKIRELEFCLKTLGIEEP